MEYEQLVVFQLASEEYAIPIAKVKEIVNYSGAIKVPNMPGYMEGMINLRGKVLPVMDLAEKFDLPTEKASDRQTLIVETGDQNIGLVVDAVTEVIRLEVKAIEEFNGIATSNEFIKSIGKVEQRLLIILDLDKLFTQEEMTVNQNAG